ncbi:MAG TPA: acetate CoA-transferase subunit alpha [Clostridiales bacterium]|jgi:acetate CoA/acetoacetate CoA-transferase alpha subunit|nr:acetate CoA-transferase subunit alpha [Clostridiales bacterium]
MVKIVPAAEAAAMVKEGMTVMVGGFLACGTPQKLVDQVLEQGTKNLTLVCNDTAFPDQGVGKLIVNKQFKKAIVSHIGTNPETGRQMNAGELEVDLVPQGTLAERIRSAGFGLGGILTPTGVGTPVEEGKQKLTVKGKDYLLELPIQADVALIKAYKADKSGNLVFRKAARNFNPLMATAAQIVIVEAQQIVETGEIDPDEVMTPGIFVNYLVQG